MDTRERRILDPSELPTRPTIRLPRFSLPPALPKVPLVRGWLGEGGGLAAPGALPDPTPAAVGGKEAAYGGR
jgi:hypothetical protein